MDCALNQLLQLSTNLIKSRAALRKAATRANDLALTDCVCVQVPCEADRAADRRLTVGYVSPDLFTHSVSYFAEAPLRHHRKDLVRLMVYNCVPKVSTRPAYINGLRHDAGACVLVLRLADGCFHGRFDIAIALCVSALWSALQLAPVPCPALCLTPN